MDAMDNHSLAVGRVFCWHECNVPDKAAAAEFYKNALDWETEEMQGMDYTMFKVGGTNVGGIMPTVGEHAGIPPHWSVYISVDDVDARAAKVTEGGGTIVVPAFDVPTVGRMCLCHDPQGAHFWLFKGSA